MKLHEIPFNPENGSPIIRVIINPNGDASDFWGDTLTLRVGVKSGDSLYIARPLDFEKRDEMKIHVDDEPALSVSKRAASGVPRGDIAQSMMDQLWEAGVRPKDIGTPGHLAATQAHLIDMRALVAKTLDVKLP